MLLLSVFIGCGSPQESNNGSNEDLSFNTKPNTNSLVYSRYSTKMTGQCADYLKFDTSTMGITCSSLERTTSEGRPSTRVGSCGMIVNSQCFLRYYSASDNFSAEELQSNCEYGIWRT